MYTRDSGTKVRRSSTKEGGAALSTHHHAPELPSRPSAAPGAGVVPGGRSWVVESYDGEAAAQRGGGGGVVDSPPGRHRARSERCSATERREPALLVTQGRSEGGV